jgi:predicted nucleic acid-binding protein
LRYERLVFDTNVVIRHELGKVPGIVSAVVLQELAAGASDDAEMRRLGEQRLAAERTRMLLTPDGEDWYHAGKVLNSLLRGLRSRQPGPRASIDRGEQQRLLRDVLIARSARRVNARVVTYNRRDFEKIRRFCKVTVVEPKGLV